MLVSNWMSKNVITVDFVEDECLAQHLDGTFHIY